MRRAQKRVRKSPGLGRLRSLPNSVAPFSWLKNGEAIVTGIRGGGLSVWNPRSGELIAQYDCDDNLDAVSGYGDSFATISENTITLWNTDAGVIGHIELPQSSLGDRSWPKSSLRWSPCGRILAASYQSSAYLVDVASTSIISNLEHDSKETREKVIVRLAWSTDSHRLAAASYHAETWDVATGKGDRFEFGPGLYDVAWSPDPTSKWLVAGSTDRSIIVWDSNTKRQGISLEGHTDHVMRVAFSSDGLLLFSTSRREGIIWSSDGWRPLTRFTIGSPDYFEVSPSSNLFAITSSRGLVQIWRADASILLNEEDLGESVTYTSAKIVLVGDSGVGKTGLGWRLANGSFKEHASTHGQQFWLLDDLSVTRADGATCEAILWDLAGQPDYRLIHALFLDDADLALVVCDPTHPDSPVQGVEFWLRQLRISSLAESISGPANSPPAALVAGRCDRGTPRVTHDELLEFCEFNGLRNVFYTSALDGSGIDSLISWMRSAIAWGDKPATVTTVAFKRIKDYVLHLKESRPDASLIIYTASDLLRLITADTPQAGIDLNDVLTAIHHLSNHGYVTRLLTSRGETKVLLKPELLNNLAASFVLEARRNIKGLGSLLEKGIPSSIQSFPELNELVDSDRETMIDSTISMFLKHNVCFRETDPLNRESYIIFPELINLKKPFTPDKEVVEDDVSYTVTGSVENVYSSLVVLLGYTTTFTRTAQWRGHARYEVGEGLVCGFRLEADRNGEQDFVLYFGMSVGPAIRSLFKSLFESFLSRHEVSIRRFEPVLCSNSHQLNRVVLRELAEQNAQYAHCSRCGDRVALPDVMTPTQLSGPEAAAVRRQHKVADMRSRFEEALFRISAYSGEQKIHAPSCFISYAWGNTKTENWVRRRLAHDLVSAGIDVVLDYWDNLQVGSSITRFVDRAKSSDKVIVVGTPEYLKKYDNSDPNRGTVVAAEADIISSRLLGPERLKSSVMPVLLDGSDDLSFPPLLLGRAFADFREDALYFQSALNLILSVYNIANRNHFSENLRDSFARAFD